MMVSLAMEFVVLTFSSLEEPMTFVFLRGLLEKDSELLLKWRNHPDTRRNSLHTEEVSPEDHARWFQNMIINRPQEVLVATIEGEPVGVIRFDWSPGNDTCEISLTVAPEHRGKGVGFAMAENFIHDMHNVRIVARIKAHNLPSRRIFEKLGFHTIGDDKELLLYAKDLGPPSQ
jgi:RimJ/RimL family protein N-acetyltransferase